MLGNRYKVVFSSIILILLFTSCTVRVLTFGTEDTQKHHEVIIGVKDTKE